MKQLLFISLLFLSVKAYAYEQIHYPGTVANEPPETTERSWENPDNAKVEDGVVTSTGVSFVGSTMLKASNFGFFIPVDATIHGIKGEIKQKGTTDVIDKSVVLFDINGSSLTSANRGKVDIWPTSLEYVVYGSTSDLWGMTFTANDVNNSNFGVGISAQRDVVGSHTAEIDAIRMTIYYTRPTIIESGVIYSGTLR